MQAVGYAHLHQQLQLTVVPLQLPAVVQPVTRIQQIGTTLAVPAAIAPAANDLLGHALFALKHEGINLALLAQALPKIPAEAFEDALRSTPNGIYIRKADQWRCHVQAQA